MSFGGPSQAISLCKMRSRSVTCQIAAHLAAYVQSIPSRSASNLRSSRPCPETRSTLGQGDPREMPPSGAGRQEALVAVGRAAGVQELMRPRRRARSYRGLGSSSRRCFSIRSSFRNSELRSRRRLIRSTPGSSRCKRRCSSRASAMYRPRRFMYSRSQSETSPSMLRLYGKWGRFLGRLGRPTHGRGRGGALAREAVPGVAVKAPLP